MKLRITTVILGLGMLLAILIFPGLAAKSALAGAIVQNAPLGRITPVLMNDQRAGKDLSSAISARLGSLPRFRASDAETCRLIMEKTVSRLGWAESDIFVTDNGGDDFTCGVYDQYVGSIDYPLRIQIYSTSPPDSNSECNYQGADCTWVDIHGLPGQQGSNYIHLVLEFYDSSCNLLFRITKPPFTGHFVDYTPIADALYSSALEVNCGQTGTVTKEYIFATYGIRVEDSLAGDPYGQKAWSEHELSLLNDVLKELPPSLLKNMALTSFVRNQYGLDKKGNPDPYTFGAYYCCGLSGVPDMSGSSATIKLFDQASSPFTFTNDPDGDTEFKATILHEMIHAMQYRRDQYSVYDNAYKSPLVQTYMDSTTPLDAVDTAIWENGWIYYETRGGSGNWKLWSNEENKPPTDYGLKNPKDDMSESVMMYVYNPQLLKESSKLRYNFIKSMFGGIEYENGVQKTP